MTIMTNNENNDKAFNGTVVNRTYATLFEITSSVHLIFDFHLDDLV